jgi:hypothetical protein
MHTIRSAGHRNVKTIVDQDTSLGACRRANAPANQIAKSPVVQIALANLDEAHTGICSRAYERNQCGQALVG